MSMPWGLIASYFNSLGKNISTSEEARAKAEKEQPTQEGYEYGSAPNLDRSSFESGSPASVGANLIGDYNKMLGKQILGSAVEGEADMYAPDVQARGAAYKAPVFVNSNRSPFANSVIQNYLNYAKYGRY